MINEEGSIRFRLFNIDFNIHWTVLFFLVSFSGAQLSIIEILTRFFTAMIVIGIHELGHSFFCKYFNYAVYGITIHGFGGFCYHDEVQYKSENTIIAAGGVIFQFILLVISILIYKLSIHFSFSSDFLSNILLDRFVAWNLILIVLNLLPIKGLDGYEVFHIYKINVFKNCLIEKRNKQREIKDNKRKQEKLKKQADRLRLKVINHAKKNYINNNKYK